MHSVSIGDSSKTGIYNFSHFILNSIECNVIKQIKISLIQPLFFLDKRIISLWRSVMENIMNLIPKDSRFLVTGGAGFIGTNIVHKILKLGYRVVVLDNFSTGNKDNIKQFYDNPNFELINGDIRNIEDCFTACSNIDFVLHNAAIRSVPRSMMDPISTNDVNIAGTLNMLIAAKEKNAKKFIYASSSSVYGEVAELPLREGMEGEPKSAYAITKKANEMYGQLFYKQFKLPTIGLRYFNVFGKYQEPNSKYATVIPCFVKKLLNNEPPIIHGDGTQTRDFTYVENVVYANLKACVADEKAYGQVFNIGCGQNISILELYNRISESLEINIKPIFISRRIGDMKDTLASMEKSKELIGYETIYDFNYGLEKTLQWYRENS